MNSFQHRQTTIVALLLICSVPNISAEKCEIAKVNAQECPLYGFFLCISLFQFF